MRFMMLVKSAENAGPPPQGLMEAIAKSGVEQFQAGTMVDMGGLTPSAMGAKVRLSGGVLEVIDGPFSEAKEVIGGYAVFELPSREAAIQQAVNFMEMHKKHWPEWSGETELRQIMTPPGA